jgi:hypothetical protein
MAQLNISGLAHWVRQVDYTWITKANKLALFPTEADPIENWPLPVVLQLVVTTVPSGKFLVDLKASNFDIGIASGNTSTSCKAIQIDRTGWFGVRVLAVSPPPNNSQLFYGADMALVKIKYSKLSGSMLFSITN